jgi:tetratricopeptide (TPR) repeat protein
VRRGLPARLAAALLLGALAVPAPAAPDRDADAAFVRGQRLEEALGDLEAALGAFRQAAGSADASRRAAARLREAGVLRRLGRDAEARAALEALLADGPASEVAGAREAAAQVLAGLGSGQPPSESPELTALRDQKRVNEEETLRLKRELSEALKTTAEVEPLRATLQEKEKQLEELRGKLRDAERAARGGVGELTEREREERRREDAESRRILSSEWTRYGRDFYMSGRFEDARRFLRDAVDLDPENSVARDLLARASAPNGDRAQIVRGILEIVAMEQELRAEQCRIEANSLLEEGRRLLDGGDAPKALEKLDAALARLAAPADLRERLEPLRAQVARLFDEAAKKAGSKRRAPAPPPAVPGEDVRLQDAVRAVLERAGSAGETGGAALRIFTLGPSVRVQRESLPPSPEAGTTPRGFALSADVPPLGPLLRTAVLGAVEPAAWRGPGAVLEGVGETLVARAGTKVLDVVAKTVGALSEPPSRSLLVRATALPCDPAQLVAALARAGVTLAPIPRGGGAAAALDAAGAEAMMSALGGPGGAAADVAFRVPAGRAFALAALRPGDVAAAEDELPGLRIRGIGWYLADGGIATGLEVESASPGPAGAAEALGAPILARQIASYGAALSPGGAILVSGLGNPLAEGAPHLAVLLRFGEGAALPSAPGDAAAETVLPLGDLPGRNADLPGPLPAAAGDRTRTARAEVLRRWLERRLPAGAGLRVEGTALRVAGSPAAAALVAADLERLRNAKETPGVQIRAYALDARTESTLVRGFPLLSAGPDAGTRYVRFSGDERKRHLFLLEGLGKRITLGADGALRPAPAQRAALGRVEGAAPRLAGFEVGVRAWPGDRSGEGSFWIDLAVQRSGEEAPSREPEAKVSLPSGTAFLFVGLANPFPDAGAKPKIALWIEAGEP